eukprot:COSAG02_NODE_132_length_34701_cov_707.955234_15_plen_61_part_00
MPVITAGSAVSAAAPYSQSTTMSIDFPEGDCSGRRQVLFTVDAVLFTVDVNTHMALATLG